MPSIELSMASCRRSVWVRRFVAVTCVAALGVGCTIRLAPAPGAAASASGPLAIPVAPSTSLVPRTVVARNLANPRGLHPLPGGALLVAEAGKGDPVVPESGGLLRLDDVDGDGRYESAGERTVLLDAQPSANILDIVRRDEVFGMAAIAEGDGTILASLAFFLGPSTIYRVSGSARADGHAIDTWATVHGNINALDYDRERGAWLGISSSADEVVWLRPGKGADRIVKIPPLVGGQDPVPGYVRYEPRTRQALVTLFSGSTLGEEGGEGTELELRAGGIVRVDPATRATEWIVTGLTAPTDLVIDDAGRVYVLEFCDGFEDPVSTRAELWDRTGHGGFTRFSGRLLRLDLGARTVEVLAEGLDAPTNLALADDVLFVSEGMGTPGRSIPGPDGPVTLDGFIERVSLAATAP